MKLERILVPVDGSKGSQAALAHAIDLQAGHPAELVIVMALEPIHLRIGAQITRPGTNIRMLADEQRMIAEDRLARLAADLRTQGARVRTVVATGAADEVILATAKKLACELIVMSTHGRAGLMHMLLGSITEKVIRGSTCPVLTVRGYDAKTKAKRS